jgi:hypothetical protein
MNNDDLDLDAPSMQLLMMLLESTHDHNTIIAMCPCPDLDRWSATATHILPISPPKATTAEVTAIRTDGPLVLQHLY